MKKTLLLVGALCVLGTTAFGATKINSEVRVIEYKNGAADKIEYTIMEGKTDITENIKFAFDLDLDTEYNSSDRSKYIDSDWRLEYVVPQEVLDHKLTVSYELDYDYNIDRGQTSSTGVKGNKGEAWLHNDLRFEFAKDNYYIAPSYNYDNGIDDDYLQLDVAFGATGPLGTDVSFEFFNYFDKEDTKSWDADLEIYISKTIPFYGINLKPELGYEGYNLLAKASKDETDKTKATTDSSVYVQIRIDKSFDVAEGFVVTPYAAYTDYTTLVDGSADDIYTEFGVETSYKF